MIIWILYAYYFRDLELDYRVKIVKGGLVVLCFYYWILYQIRELVYWLICIDIFIFAILILMHKNSKFGKDNLEIKHTLDVMELNSIDVNSKKIIVI